MILTRSAELHMLQVGGRACHPERKCKMMPTLLVRPLRGALVILACVASLMLCSRADAQTSDIQSKVAADLMATISSSSTTPTVPWARTLNGELLVRVIVTADSDDVTLTALRQYVLSLGGSVYYNYASIRALAVMLPASRLLDLASRADVFSISPNRAVTRTASLLRLTTGAATAPPPPGRSAPARS